MKKLVIITALVSMSALYAVRDREVQQRDRDAKQEARDQQRDAKQEARDRVRETKAQERASQKEARNQGGHQCCGGCCK